MLEIKEIENIKPETNNLLKYFKNYWGEELTSRGLAIVPQVLLEYRADLKLSYAELYFIEKLFILDFKNFRYIKDRDISAHNSRNLFVIRERLKEKGYLDYKVAKDNRRGIIYSLAGLKAAVEKLVREDNRLRETLPEFFEEDTITPNMFEEFDKKNKAKIKKETKKQKEEIENISNKNNKNEEKKESKEENQSKEDKFIKMYNKLHIKLLGFDLLSNKKNYNNLKKYLSESFNNRKRTSDIALNIAEKSFLNLKENQKTSLKLQDLVRQSLSGNLNIEKEEITRRVPRGLYVANTLLKKVKEGKDFNTEYAKFESAINEDYNNKVIEDYKNNKAIEEKQKEKYIKKWGIENDK